MEGQPDPLTLKLRTSLFQIRKKGPGKVRLGCTQGPLLGVTVMTKRYKSRRRLDLQPPQRSQRQNDQNQLKTEIFKRIALVGHKRDSGLQIQKAVIHSNQQQKIRLSTQRSCEDTEIVPSQHFSKESLYKRLIKNRKALSTRRDNLPDFRASYFRSSRKPIHSERPCSAFTEQFIRKGARVKRTGTNLMDRGGRQEEIEGWDVDNQQQFDCF